MSTPARPIPPRPGQPVPHRLGPPPRTGLATAALVLGIFSLAASCIPLVDLLAASAGLTGAVLGSVALRASCRTGAGRGRALAGTALSSLGLLATVLVVVLVALSIASHAARVAEHTSTRGEDGQAVGPMVDDVHLDDCHEAELPLWAADLTVTNSTGSTRRYRVVVTAYDSDGAVVGTLSSRSREIAAGVPTTTYAEGWISGPAARCVVSQVTRR